MSLMVAAFWGGFRISYSLRLKPPLVAMLRKKYKQKISKNQAVTNNLLLNKPFLLPPT